MATKSVILSVIAIVSTPCCGIRHNNTVLQSFADEVHDANKLGLYDAGHGDVDKDVDTAVDQPVDKDAPAIHEANPLLPSLLPSLLHSLSPELLHTLLPSLELNESGANATDIGGTVEKCAKKLLPMDHIKLIVASGMESMIVLAIIGVVIWSCFPKLLQLFLILAVCVFIFAIYEAVYLDGDKKILGWC